VDLLWAKTCENGRGRPQITTWAKFSKSKYTAPYVTHLVGKHKV